MCGGISDESRIAIIGAGNLATAMAPVLLAAGYAIEQIVSRPAANSLRKARKLARQLESRAVPIDATRLHAGMVWFLVPDTEIEKASRSLLEACDWHGKIALHSTRRFPYD